MTTSMPPPGYEPAPEGWGTSRGPSPGRPGDPLTRTLLRVVFGLAVLLILLIAIAWHYDGGDADLNPIAEAAQRTASMPGAKIAMTATYSTSGHSFTFRAEGGGEINWRTGRGRMKLTVPIPGHEFSVEAINDTRTIYMRTSLPDQSLPPGKEWVAVEPFLGHDPGTEVVGSADAQQTLRSLEACGGDVEDLGEEPIRGVATTHYRGTIERDRLERKLRSEGKADVAKLVDRAYRGGQGSFPVEVWIDADGLVRRIRQEMPVAGEDGATDLTMDMRVELYDFGAEPEIDLPPAESVFDATPLVKAELGSPAASPKPKPQSKPEPAAEAALSRADFRAEVTSVCADMKQDADRLKQQGEPSLKDWQDAIRSSGLDSRASLRTGQVVAENYFGPISELAQTAFDRLSSISPPPSIAPDYRRYLRISSVQLEELSSEIRALEVGDYALLKRVSKRYDRIGKPAKKLARKLGISACEDSE
jgi:hypothetical protein